MIYNNKKQPTSFTFRINQEFPIPNYPLPNKINASGRYKTQSVLKSCLNLSPAQEPASFFDLFLFFINHYLGLFWRCCILEFFCCLLVLEFSQ